jgi:membrane protease YdiL (CAAX protease family)
VRWGLGDVALGLLVAQALATFGGLAILIATGNAEEGAIDTAPLALLFALQIPLWAGYFGVAWWASRTKGDGLVADFGLRSTWLDAVYGTLIGVATQAVIVPLVLFPVTFWSDEDPSEVARELTDRVSGPLDVIVLVVLVVVCAPIVEEVFYRGLVLRSLENRFGTAWAVALTAIGFGAIHFQLLQFPALAAFGLVASLLTVRTRRLGPAIWAHVGFNGTTVAFLLTIT